MKYLGALLSLVSLPCSAASPVPQFSYSIKADPSGYAMRIEMVFSREVGLNRVISHFQDDRLLHELYPNAEVGTTFDVIHPPSRPIYETAYKKILSIKNYGWRTRMQSNCSESLPPGRSIWYRHCELDLTALDGGHVMNSKVEQTNCLQLNPTEPVRCTLEVRGSIKPFFIVSAPVLTVKAKVQALINWGRFWFFVETGGISAAVSNGLFDQSSLAKEIEAFSEKGLARAKQKEARFELLAEGLFDAPAIR